MGLSWPSGTGAGAVCSAASLAASDKPEPRGGAAVPLRSRKSVTRKNLFAVDMGPKAWALGQKFGTALWMAFRDACSPG